MLYIRKISGYIEVSVVEGKWIVFNGGYLNCCCREGFGRWWLMLKLVVVSCESFCFFGWWGKC